MPGKLKSARSEQRLLVGETEHVLLYNMAALADAEVRTGKSITALIQAAQTNSLGLGDTAQLLVAGLEAARRAFHTSSKAFQLQRGFEIMEAAGYAKVTIAVFEGIAEVLGFDPDDEDAGGADDSADPPAR